MSLKSFTIPAGSVSFCLEDMMSADVKDAQIVVLTSLCWDIKTRRSVARKVSPFTIFYVSLFICD